MRNTRPLIAACLVLVFLDVSAALAQSVARYAPVVRTTGIAYESIDSTGFSLSAWRNGSSNDDNRSFPEAIGFTFHYDGQAYTTFSVSLNGFVDLSTSTASGAGNGAYGYSNAQFSAPNGTLLTLAPLYDDLQHSASATLKSSVMFEVTGLTPNRVLTIEWIGLEAVGFPAGDLDFQLKLYEATGAIEFVYGPLAGGGAAYTYTCGINGPAMPAVPTDAELLTQQTANTDNFGSAPQNALSALPENNSKLTFTPAQSVTPAPPALMTFGGVTQTAMTVGWTDSSSTETYFTVSRSSDGVSFAQVASVPSTTESGMGATYSAPQSGLIPGATYYFRITANNEASPPSAYLAGDDTTLPPGAVASVQSGNWSNPATWSTAAVPQPTDNVTIADGDTVTIDTAATCLDLTVGQGVSGVLRFEAAAARTLTVGLDVTVAPGAAFETASTGTQTGHVLSLGRNLVNGGTLDLSTNGNTAGAALVFTGATNAAFTGSGAVSDLRALTVNKGSSLAPVLDVSPDALTVRGVATDAAGFLTLANGTLRIGGSYALTNRFFTAAAYTIPASAGFWLDNPNVTVAAQSAANAVVNGLLRITQGTYNVGTASGMSLGAGAGAVFQIEGGALNVAGRLSTTAAVTYAQSGGTVSVSTVGNTASSSGSFELAATGTSFSATGGAIVLVNANTAVSSRLDYKVVAALVGAGTGTLQVGSAASPPSSNFRIVGSMPRLVVDGSASAKTATLFSSIPTPQATEVVVEPGCTLNLNGFSLTVRGSVTNDGAITGSTSGSRLLFLAVSPQSYAGSGTAVVDILALDNAAGLTIDAGVASNVVAQRVNLLHGLLSNSQKLTIGTGSATVAMVQIGAIASMSAGGSFDAQPALNLGAGGFEILYMPEDAPRTTGFEIPLSRTFNKITMQNGSGVTLAGGGITLTSGLVLTNGIFHTDASNVLSLANTIASPPGGSSASYVDGPLSIEFDVATPTARTFAIGRAGKFRPLTLKSVNTSDVSRTFTAEMLDGASGGTPEPPLDTLDPVRSWRIAGSSNLNDGARVNLTFGSDDGVTDVANARVAQSAGLSGTYSSLGGVATGNPSMGSVESVFNLVPGSDYFTVAVEYPPITWDGGAGTANWGDALNWNTDAVPDSSTRILLSAVSPVAIDVNGAFACAGLSIRDNVTLDLLANALDVRGSFDQTAGTVHVSDGALAVDGPFSLSGGTFDIGAGTASAGGAMLLGGSAVTLVTGTLAADDDFTLASGSIALGSGTLEVKGAFAASGGTFTAGSGTTVFSGEEPQSIGGGVTHHDLVLRGGGAAGKTLAAGAAYAVANDFAVESTAQLGVSAAAATTMTVGGNFSYGGSTGGPNLASLTIQLTGSGKTIGGSSKSAPLARRELPGRDASGDRFVSWLTDPASATGPAGADGKPALALENTYEKRRADIERLLLETGAEHRLVVDLDDATLERNPAPSVPLTKAASTFEMLVTVAAGAGYSLGEDIAIGSGRTLSVQGRLDCGAWRIGGDGGVALGASSTLGTGSTDTLGLGGTLVNTGVNSYSSGCTVEYNAAADQTIHPAYHPAAAMIYTAGSGTKTLSGNKSITGNSGALLTKGALVVAAGSTFSDGGNILSFITPGWANVIIHGGYASSGSGGISYESGAFYSNILAEDGTAFGDLAMNFLGSVYTVDLNAQGVANLSFRNIVFGGTAGAGNAGGTLLLNESGTTYVTVTGDVTIAPEDPALTGGGFAGMAPAAGLVTVLGNVISTSTAAAQPIFSDSGTNVLVMGGSAAQSFTLAASATIFTGATWRITNPAGVTLGGSGIDVTIGGTLDLAGGNVVTVSNTLALAATGSVMRTSGHVAGPFRKPVLAGPGVGLTFEIGTGADFTPVDVNFGTVSTAGALTASSTAGDHPNLAASGIDPAQSVNRVYSLANAGALFDTAGATFHFVPGDVDAGADTSGFIVRRWIAPDWYPSAAGARTGTSTEATGLTAFGEFAIGEEASHIINASSNAGGTIDPSGTVLVPPGESRLFTIAPDSCHTIAFVLVDGVPVGAVTNYTFTNVHESHTIEVVFAIRTFTIMPSAGPHGTIAPAETLVVNCGADQRFDVVADSCYHVADVVVDGGSVGAVSSYTFQNVAAGHTISATFAIDLYAVTATAGAGGSVTPAGVTQVACGESLLVAIAPDSCHVIADVLVDGNSVGPVTSHLFAGVTANHTIAASFEAIVFTIASSAGPGGSIDPAGPVSVECGTDRAFSIVPDPGYGIANVRVDSDSIGPVAGYTFTGITADHTIEASFVLTAPNVVTLAPSPVCISTVEPCVTVPINIYRSDATPIRAYSVTIALSPELRLCEPGPSISQGNYFGARPAAFQVVDHLDGTYTIDASVLGWPCDAADSLGTLFTVSVESAGTDGTGSVDLTNLVLRDCFNEDIACASGPVATFTIDMTPPAAVAGLTATQVKTGNDADGTTKVSLAFTPPVDATAEVYRAPYASAGVNAYPEYDDVPGAAAPAAPSYPPAAPWALATTGGSGGIDETPVRGFWYYVAFAKDACGNVSAASTMTGGTLNYHLGDTHDTVTDCAGDNVVLTADVSFLGAHYGDTLSTGSPLACLDVGPTDDLSTDGLPTTDDVLDFEDLMMFTLNYAVFSSPGGPPQAADEVVVEAPAAVGAGADFTVTVRARGTGALRGVSFRLAWNAAVAAPVAVAGGALLDANGGVAYSPGAGALDAGVLSVDGLLGEGVLATVTFHAVASGDPQIAMAEIEGRDSENAVVAIGSSVVGAAEPEAPRAVELLPCVPNPFNPRTTIGFRLPARTVAELAIYAIDGRRVRVLASGPHDAGEHRAEWDGRDERGRPVSSGIYFARLRAAGVTHTRGVTLLK